MRHWTNFPPAQLKGSVLHSQPNFDWNYYGSDKIVIISMETVSNYLVALFDQRDEVEYFVWLQKVFAQQIVWEVFTFLSKLTSSHSPAIEILMLPVIFVKYLPLAVIWYLLSIWHWPLLDICQIFGIGRYLIFVKYLPLPDVKVWQSVTDLKKWPLPHSNLSFITKLPFFIILQMTRNRF